MFMQIYILSHLNICFKFYLSLLLLLWWGDFYIAFQEVRKSLTFYYPVILYNALHCLSVNYGAAQTGSRSFVQLTQAGDSASCLADSEQGCAE